MFSFQHALDLAGGSADPTSVNLINASENGEVETVNKLLKAGADPNAIIRRKNPLTESIKNDHPAVVKMLLEAGAAERMIIPSDIYERPIFRHGQSTLHFAAMEGSNAVLRMLLAMGVDVNIKNEIGRTALSRAAEAGLPATVDTLLAAGAEIDFTDCLGRTALSWAAAKGHACVMEVLLKAGADIESGMPKYRKGHTPLLLAAAGGHDEAVKVLLDHGARINQKDTHRRTPVMRAVINGHVDMVELLAERKADLRQVDGRGATALDFARRAEQWHIAQLLERRRS
ncbi:ankyrin repeat-containing domain protein [Aspergillus cavernicola]|uniref:Ankyrin repeat-containing domain protein n=1 Tax=Aspergillus cavernicola TaxID=176166 RepID=A0ABR4IXP9_9EURO